MSASSIVGGERVAGDLSDANDICALLSILPETNMKAPFEEEGDLDRAHYQSSSSGNSSPQHQPAAEAQPLGGITVDEIDMWDVLDVLESGPAAAPPKEFNMMSMEAAPTSVLLLDPINAGTMSSPVADRLPAKAGIKRPAAKQEVKMEAKDNDDSGDEYTGPLVNERGEPLDPNEEKRLKRMRRNRESAAMSRNRKKMYIEELEAKVVELNTTVQQLQAENAALKQQNATLRAGGEEKSGLLVPLPPSSDLEREPSPASSSDPEDEQQRPDAERPLSPSSASGKQRGSGVSAGSLAMMSALTFVTLSAVHSQSGSAQHSPGARALMSLSDDLPPVPESFSGLLQTLTETDKLWPALKPLNERGGMLPPLEEEDAAVEEGTELRRPTIPLPKAAQPSRVIKLPQNSSWSDALRFEALEARLSTAPRRPPVADAATDPAEERGLVQAGATPTVHDVGEQWSQPTKVYEPVWKADPLVDDEDDEDERDAQRYIFCSRAYMFDASRRHGPRRSSPRRPPSPPASGLDLPAAMPARFRHAAQQGVPQLTDGRNETQAAARPTVQFLLPSAALHGIAGAPVDASAGSDLLQVTCQVTNVSRVANTAA